MKIAIVGAGVAGLGAAWLLDRDHEVHVFEAAPRAGGHANTIDIQTETGPVAVDTGFIVYNDRNYPNFCQLLSHLGVRSEPSDMSFSVSVGKGAFEYEGSLRGLLAQPLNLFRPRHSRMVRDIVRFYREAPALLVEGHPSHRQSIGEYLATGGYSVEFLRDHLFPMGAAIWSCSLAEMGSFPARAFIRFFANHGLLSLTPTREWRTIRGGSRVYVDALTAQLKRRVRTNTPVASVRRTPAAVFVRPHGGEEERFDQVVFGAHADQVLTMLGPDAHAEERSLLGSFRFTNNRAILHTDTALMPRRRAAWASWNYLSDGGNETPAVSVTYWMNRLQNLWQLEPLFVSLNPTDEPAADRVLAEFAYDHPLFDSAALAAQQGLATIQGARRTWFCGAYCGYGFHEDGLQAGVGVAAALGSPAPWAGAITPMSPALAAVTPAAIPAAA